MNNNLKISNYYKNWLKEVDQLIASNLHDSNFNIEQLVMKLSISRTQFYRRITKITGETPSSYLRNKRLKKAKELLEIGTCSTIKEVAFNVGFQQTGYFSKMFKKKYDIYPKNLL